MTKPTDRLSTALAGRYRIERRLGEGGMATVYLAQDLKHDRKVALKVLRPELAAVLGAERFVQEIKTTAALQHPHILPLYDSGQAVGRIDRPSAGGSDAAAGQPAAKPSNRPAEFLYYVMPYIQGETLRERLNRETQLGIDEAVRFTTEIADALEYAHEQGVIHRDIKPENILLQNGRAMVADFGIALAVSAAAGGRMTETGLSLGTPHYMSPEQATADKHVTSRSDIYSLGCVLFEMLTGEPPHTGASAQAIIMKIVTDQARPITELRKSVPPHVAAATAKALEKLPADRFESARAFAEALHNPAFTTAGIAATGQAAASAVPPFRRSAATMALAATTIVAVALAVWGWLRPAPWGPVTRNRVEVPLEFGLGNDFGTNLALSPDGQHLAHASAVDGTSKLWMLDRNQLTPRALPGTEGAHQPFFSPDGNRVAFVTWERNLKIVSLGGEPPTTLLDSGIVRGGGAWGPDGYLYLAAGSATASIRRGLVRLPATGGDLEQVTQVDSARQEIAHYFPAVLPGGRGVVFTIHRGRQYDAATAEIAVVDLRTGIHRTLLQGILAQWSSTGHLVVVRADGALVAAPFDPRRLELTGPATPLLDGVGVEDLASADLALSGSGVLVYQPDDGSSGQDWQPVWVSRRGESTPVDPGWTGRFRFPALSPDGTQLALTVVDAEQQIWIKQLDRGPFSKLTFEGRTNQRPTWNGNRSVAFASDAQGAGVNLDLYQKRADGSAQAELLLDMPGAVQEVEWSRDGQWAVLRINSQPGGDLVAWRPGVDSAPASLVTSDFDEINPALSPDGRWLAYSSNESGRYEVYVRPFPEASRAKWQVSTSGGTQPRWANGGRELFYVDGERQLVAATVLLTPSFSVGDRTVLFSMIGFGGGDGHRIYDVTRDDRRFLMIRSLTPDGGETVSLITVDNFGRELLDKVTVR